MWIEAAGAAQSGLEAKPEESLRLGANGKNNNRTRLTYNRAAVAHTNNSNGNKNTRNRRNALSQTERTVPDSNTMAASRQCALKGI